MDYLDGIRTLKQRVIHAGGWTMVGYGGIQLLRLAGNLVLTRLLFPEAFGLMAIVQAILIGVTLLSDVGIEQSIIQDKRGAEPSFLNMAWTIQIIRGVLIFLVLWLMADTISSFYDAPMLAALLPVVGVTAVINGFSSTKLSLAERNLNVARRTMIEFGTYAVGIAATIPAAMMTQSIWSLVFGNIVSALTKSIASHYFLPGSANRIEFDSESLKSIMVFGRWVFIGSALTFAAGEGNRLIIANFLDVEMLAFYSLAIAINLLPTQVMMQIGAKVLFPAYAEVARNQPERLYSVLQRSRMIQIAPYWLMCAGFALYGREIMGFLYDERYQDSGWMLQYLALGSLVGSLAVTYNGVLWAKGLSRMSTVLVGIQVMIQIPAMIIGLQMGGGEGLVIAIACVAWLMYPVHAFVYWRISLWQPKVDLPVIAASLLLTALVAYPALALHGAAS